MTWGKVDDNFAFHPKALIAGNEALGLWVRSLSWSNQLLTDGFIPQKMIVAMSGNESAQSLVEAGLWHEVDGGYQFKDWLLYQPSRESVLADREAAKERMAKARENKTRSSANVQANILRTSDNPEPEPEPEPEPSITKVIDISSNADDEKFNQFWAIYPRKENKQSARRAFKQALKAETLETILAGAERYRDDPNRDPAYTKHGQTWLNNHCWNDDPQPARNKANAKLANQQLAREAFLSATTPEITTNPDWAEIE